MKYFIDGRVEKILILVNKTMKDSKVLIKSRKSKDTQYNVQK
jgi:hypothetical protein